MTAAFTYVSYSEEQTSRLAEALAGWMGPGTVIALDGDLGAGKTRFSQAVARQLGVPGVVNSPTFTLIKEYQGGRLPLYHMDVYRIGEEDADLLGLDEYFYGDGVTLVEWAERIERLLPEAYLAIQIRVEDEHTRRLELKPHGEPYAAWCRQLKGLVE